jgi:hypothetical protein
MTTLRDCPACKGAKTITVETTTIEGATRKVDHVILDCVTCGGIGKVTATRAAALAREAAMWCSCGNPSGDADYHPDTRRMKHHWTCRDCAKVLQVG